MGLLDLASNVVTNYRANIDEHVRKLEKLKGVERERAQAAIDGNKGVSASLKDYQNGLENLGKAFGIVTKVAETFWDGYEHLQEKRRLDSAAGFADIENLRRASVGLKTDFELLATAAKHNSGEFKLTTAQFATAEKAMLALNRGGSELAKSQEAVTKAVVTLKTEGLAELGHGLDLSDLKMNTASGRAEAFARIMQHLDNISRQAGEGQADFGREADMALTSFRNSWDSVKDKMGEVVQALGPLLLGLAELLVLAGRIAVAAADPTGKAFSMGKDAQEELDRIRAQTKIDSDVKGFAVGPTSSSATARNTKIPKMIGGRLTYVDATPDDIAKWKAELAADKAKAEAAIKAAQAAAAAELEKRKALIEKDVKSLTDDLVERLEKEILERNQQSASDSLAQLSPRGGFDADVDSALKKFYGKGGEQERRTKKAYEDFTGSKSQSRLEDIFGPIGEFNVYQQAFDALGGAIGSALGAWIDGSKSAGEAFKSFIGQAIKGIAIQMAMEALKHGAYALGSLAFGDARGASLHGLTAAKFAAGAVVAAGVARSLGGDSSGASAGAGAGRAPTVGGSGASSATNGTAARHEVIVINDPYGDQTPRQRAAGFKRQAQRAMGSTLGGDW